MGVRFSPTLPPIVPLIPEILFSNDMGRICVAKIQVVNQTFFAKINQ
jgi:hypothetical protein